MGTAATVALIAGAVAGCGSSASSSGGGASGGSSAKPAATAPASSSASGTSAASGKWLSYNASAKTATVKLVAGYTTADGGFNYDGATKGSMTFTVPKGYKVTVDLTNKGQLPHGAAIVGMSGTTLAFPNASTPHPTVGTAPGKSASFSFTASKVGHYRIACLVPGHIQAGMWINLNIAASGTPSETA